ncbi:MAG: box helicase domain protein, partial [Akkermansiaceae bacterium]|nr:box helicase domain protein [Akkermansiaceae bacterium]
MGSITPTLEIAALDFIPRKEVEALAAAGLRLAGDLLDWLPRRYEDRRRFDAFPTYASATAVCLRGMVIDAKKSGFGGRRMFYEAVVVDSTGGVFGGGKITLRWFN